MCRISNKNSLNRNTFKHLVFRCRKEVLLTDKPAVCDTTPTLTKTSWSGKNIQTNTNRDLPKDYLLLTYYLFHVKFVSLAPIQILIGVDQSKKDKSGLGEL